MPLAPGTHLGPYEIQSVIGAGGMGEVYRARDTRLDRIVAIKVLPQDIAATPERRLRFEREARAVSSLSHPHICVLHDIGQDRGIDFLVMEYLAGETLADRLGKGAVRLEEALRIAIQIADALDKAHHQGIVHRDLKPGNIMLVHRGGPSAVREPSPLRRGGPSGPPEAKLLDFGLAKARGTTGAPAVEGVTMMPAERPITMEGTILGTFQYMAPEQLEGKDADARTDIFAFGALLYEMVTGRKAFEGKSQASLIAAILAAEPKPTSAVQPLTPPVLDRVIAGCLAKDPDDRWQSMHDVLLQLKSVADAPPTAAPATGSRRAPQRLAWGLASVFLVTTLVLAAIAIRGGRPEPGAVTRFTIAPPEGSYIAPGPAAPQLAISPDGRRLAFATRNKAGELGLWLRAFDGHAAQPLVGTEGAQFPFWSPDGRFIGFFAGSALKKIELSSGSVQLLCNVPAGQGGTWNRQDVIVFAANLSEEGLYRVAAAGGRPTPVTKLDSARQETGHLWPQFLPDGRHFLYLAPSNEERHRGAFIGSLDSAATSFVMPTQTRVVFAEPGYLLFVREGALVAQRFDATRLRLAGDPIFVVDQVGSNPRTGRAAFSVSGNGVLAYRMGGVSGVPITEMAWFDRAGKEIASFGSPARYRAVNLSPDERRVAADREEAGSGAADIWLFELSRRVSSRFTFDPSDDSAPVWSPNGDRIVFASRRALYQKASTGSGPAELLLQLNRDPLPTDWSPDGRFIVYELVGQRTQTDLWVLPLSGDRKPRAFLQTEYSERQAALSSDGRWIAYASDESGRSEIYVRPFPNGDGKWQVSTEGGLLPQWRADGKEIFYISGGSLMAVPVRADSIFEAGAAARLFEVPTIPYGMYGPFGGYAAAASGQRFLLGKAEDDPSPITVVLNWTAALRK